MTRRQTLEIPTSFWRAYRTDRIILDETQLKNEDTLAFHKSCTKWRKIICVATNHAEEPITKGQSAKLILQMHEQLEAFLATYEDKPETFKENAAIAMRFYKLKLELAMSTEYKKTAVITELETFAQSTFSWIKKDAEELLACVPKISDSSGFIRDYATQLSLLIEERETCLDRENTIVYTSASSARP